MNAPGSQPPAARRGAPVSAKAQDLARNLLSALFMAVRTAKIHDPSNEAFENAVQAVFRSAEALFSATGGFTIQFVEDSVFLNGGRMRFESGTFATMRTLRRLLEAEGLGGIELMRPPSTASVRQLVGMFTPGAKAEVSMDLAQEIRTLGVQRLVDNREDIKVDRRVFAVQCYGKLLLAVREQLERIAQARACDWAAQVSPPRLRLVRVVQDMVELGADRADFLLRLSTNRKGAGEVELHGANTSLLAIVLGHALGLPRPDLVDVAVAGLFHHIGAPVDLAGHFTYAPQISHASLARLVAESGVGPSSYLRGLIVGEQAIRAQPGAGAQPHPYSRLVKVAATFDRWTGGFGATQPPLHPLSALARMHNAGAAELDPGMVDLLINVLRAFPVGARVVLDSGATATVTNQLGGARWDRPMVQVDGAPPRILDLSLREGGRFVDRIASTARFAGLTDDVDAPMDETAVPSRRDTADLDDLLEGEDVLPEELPEVAFPDVTLDERHEVEPLPPLAYLEEAEDGGDGLLVLPDEDLIPLTQPDLLGLPEETGPAHQVQFAAVVDDLTPPEPLPDALDDPAWGPLVPLEEDDLLPSKTVADQLAVLPAHHSDTFDEEDEADATYEGPALE
ncbi:MAG: hypothetical protein KC933_00195 [Myxococcales bacterium]|nr:hypothetical protein [Myxococcales bacterium]